MTPPDSLRPTWICSSCAALAGGRMPEGHCATFHVDFCGVCGGEGMVTEPRDYRLSRLTEREWRGLRGKVKQP